MDESVGQLHLEPGEWQTGKLVDRSGTFAYIILVRAPEDPERLPRGKGKKDRVGWQHDLAKTTIKEWKEIILQHLSDGEARTFNRIGVELLDKTADTLLQLNPEEALWSLVTEGKVAHTLRAPIYFRTTNL
jgi:hypothetical protein